MENPRMLPYDEGQTAYEDPSAGISMFVAIGQQFGVPLVSLIGLLLLPSLPWSFVRSGATGQVLEVARCFSVASAIGISLGSIVRSLSRTAKFTGRWVWVLPVLFFAAGFFRAVVTHSVRRFFCELFFPGADGEAWWGLILFTCPAISTVWYSIFVAWRGSDRI